MGPWNASENEHVLWGEWTQWGQGRAAALLKETESPQLPALQMKSHPNCCRHTLHTKQMPAFKDSRGGSLSSKAQLRFLFKPWSDHNQDYSHAGSEVSSLGESLPNPMRLGLVSRLHPWLLGILLRFSEDSVTGGPLEEPPARPP